MPRSAAKRGSAENRGKNVKRALIVVHWLTDFGGLHENVLDTAAGIAAAGWQVTVLAPPSRVGSRFQAAGVRLLENAMEDIGAAARLALARGPFDLVHAHPFQARQVGAAVAAALHVPLIVTIHGQYDDDFPEYRASVSRIVCVSAAVAEHVAERAPALRGRLSVIPNGVDFGVFAPEPTRSVAAGEKAALRIAVASRLDPDKGVLAQAVTDLVDHLGGAQERGRVELRIAGERLYGPASNPFTQAIDRAIQHPRIDVVRSGWLDDRGALRQFLVGADVAVAPGRAAMEAIACAVPTIAAGSRGYVGLVTEETLALAQATNFGGVQQPDTAYAAGAIVHDFRLALAMPLSYNLKLRGQLRFFHDVRAIQAQHVALYDNTCKSGPTV